ncbi:Dihydroorotate dehydrogenase (quinone) [Candidatus Xiphinematobacter sp. Idaho Grape]|uniref:quinone-dependent dihydroorotate dehydrogenase n=1 Tax=Candidatus Xiphinematobacter sp. Idaho Grape TaxID=1704307 RepID=UPI0007061191|nr:quinone-dependent dihydroorotate dehydrogenase [Candidatus Xiphinematobacter sp. Idaho Grape]ALJ56450.1 Dihydroorotate dehydrogenase (quinone) [Candidatus Xiphinematobacter sp. Idaho Grape]
MAFYSFLLHQLLFRMDAETAHQLILSCLSHHRLLSLIEKCFFRTTPPGGPTISLFGLQFRNPVGLAAGMDKNGVALVSWEKLGFGFVEVGTITAYPQSGNPRPRLFRFPELEALVNRMGFNNEGAKKIALRMERLRRSGSWPSIPIGINIGKSRLTAPHLAHDDYLRSFQYLYPYGDYFVLNVSSPNTPGLRALQNAEHLTRIISTLRDWEGSHKPLLIKIDPDLSSKEIVSIVKLAEREHVAGLIATNTTLDHSSLPPERNEAGGLSGKPLQARSDTIIRRIRRVSSIPIIGTGGILSAGGAHAKFSSGANLIQIYTGFVYRGPALIQEILRAYPYLCDPHRLSA